MAMDLLEFRNDLAEQGVLFCFNGPINQEMTERLGAALRAQFDLKQTRPTVTMKVFSAFVEMAQNVSRYSTETAQRTEEEGHAMGALVIGYQSDQYYIQCGNQIDAQSSEALSDFLTRIKTMDRTALRKFYKERRRDAPPAGSKGAGLGLIELARHSRDFHFEIKPLDSKTAFFTLTVYV